MLIFLIFFMLTTFSCQIQIRDDYLSCFSEKFDLNHDGIITENEIDVSLNKTIYYSSLINGYNIIANCDMNNDGFLTVAGDWNNQTSCLKSFMMNMNAFITCDICVALNWTIPVKK